MPQNSDFDNNYIFIGRQDATIALFNTLPKERMKSDNWLILCLSSGGVPMAEYISKKIGIDYDIFLVTPIWAPKNDECQIAMIGESEEIIVHTNLTDSFGISLDNVYKSANEEYEDKILKYKKKYRKSLPLSNVEGRSVLLLDEGCETGLSTVCALKSVIELGVKKVSLATPLIAEDLYQMLDLKVDNIYTNRRIRDFIDVGYYYATLEEPEPDEVKKILKNSRNYLPYKGVI